MPSIDLSLTIGDVEGCQRWMCSALKLRLLLFCEVYSLFFFTCFVPIVINLPTVNPSFLRLKFPRIDWFQTLLPHNKQGNNTHTHTHTYTRSVWCAISCSPETVRAGCKIMSDEFVTIIQCYGVCNCHMKGTLIKLGGGGQYGGASDLLFHSTKNSLCH